MAIIAVSSYSPVLGKEAEAEALMKEGLEQMKGFGAQGYVATLALGGVQNTLSLFLEFPDAETYGTALDRAHAHTDSRKLIDRGRQAQVLVPVGAADYAEIPGFEVPYDDIHSHGIIAMGVYRIRHGKHAQVHEWMKEGKQISEGLGAKIRLLQSRASDPHGITATVGYYRNFAEWAKHWAALATDARWQAYGENVDQQPPHADFLKTMVMRVV